MKLKSTSSNNKLNGVYYTPSGLCDFLTEHYAGNEVKVLEPSCGDGRFLESYLRLNNDAKITAVEIDKKMAKKLRESYENNTNINVIGMDFFDFYKKHGKQKFDLVIGNPPYIRYQYLTEHQRKVQSDILTSNGMKSNKLINAWVAFTVACTDLLADDGKLIFVIPSELLQVAYSNDLRRFLLEKYDQIQILAFEEIIFPEIEQETIAIICQKKAVSKGIKFIQVKNIDSLENLDLNSYQFQEFPSKDVKWSSLFSSDKNIEKSIDDIKQDPKFQQFGDVAIINVGITTGNNKFFSIDKRIMTDYELNSVCKPLIGRSCYFNGAFVRKKDIEANYESGKKSHLLVLKDVPMSKLNQNVQRYIINGEQNKENLGYKCKIRKHWYSVPSVWVPDAFFARRNGEFAKVLINSCNAVSTDTLHRIKFNSGIDPVKVVLSYYNSVSFAFAEICGRSYGGGVLEILPTEASKIPLPIIDDLSIDFDKILKQVDIMIRKNTPIDEVLDYTDEIILIEGLNYSKEFCMKYRSIWKELQQRRINRSK